MHKGVGYQLLRAGADAVATGVGESATQARSAGFNKSTRDVKDPNRRDIG